MSHGHAQNTSSPTTTLEKNPLAVLKDFEPAANQEYELGRGDSIAVEVLGRPELSGPHIVGPDGNITVPTAGQVMVADRTRTDAAKAIQDLLGTYYTNIKVSVGVEHYTSNRILLVGAVEHPGMLTFDTTPTLLEVISRGGAPLEPVPGTAESGIARGSGASVARSLAVPETCIIYRGNSTMVTVQLRKLLREGNPLSDMRLKRDDIVYVPGNDEYVSVLGQVSHPGTVHLDSTSTLPKLLAEAGGPSDKAGRYPDLRIIHRGTDGSPGFTKTISYRAVLGDKPLDVTIASGDIIYIPENGFNRTADVFQKLSPLVNLLTVGAIVR